MTHAKSTHRIAALIFGCLLGFASLVANAVIPASERAVLVNIFLYTNGAVWINRTNWGMGISTECTWYGVTCDASGATVTGIVLPSNNLSGPLPSLADLPNLQQFVAYNNHLTGSIPALAGLTNLVTFSVYSNQLTGSIPALTGMTSLMVFNASNNQLTGSIPALTGLTKLLSFSVYNNKLTGSIPVLAGLTKLNQLYLHDNQLTGSIPALTGLTNLAYFYVFNNQLTGPIPALTDLTNLQFFYIHYNQLTGSIPALTGLTKLAYVDASHNQLTGSIPALTGLSSLQRFHVENNQLTGNVPPVPSPNALVAAGSSLCPNFLNHTPDLNWDVATGQTPWYTNCIGTAVPPVLQSAASRRQHGVAGTFDLPLSLVAPPSINHNPTTEPRQGPAHIIVLTFDKAVTSASATITEGTATAGTPTYSGNDVIVGLTGVTNQQYVTVSLTNVASTDGGTGGGGSVRIGFLLGDVNQSRAVSIADLGLVNAQLAQTVTAANVLKDVNASGTLTLTDKGMVNANLTKALPAP